MATTSKNGYEIRSDLLGLAKSLVEFNYQAQIQEFEYKIKKDGDQVVQEFKAPTFAATDIIDIANLHEKYEYVAKYAQDRILVAHRITSPLLFGIRTEVNGFSSNADEMAMAFSILQSMTIVPFQNLFLGAIEECLESGGWDMTDLYIEQIMPLSIASKQAEESGQTITQVEDTANEQSQVDDAEATPVNEPLPKVNSAFFKNDYE